MAYFVQPDGRRRQLDPIISIVRQGWGRQFDPNGQDATVISDAVTTDYLPPIVSHGDVFLLSYDDEEVMAIVKAVRGNTMFVQFEGDPGAPSMNDGQAKFRIEIKRAKPWWRFW